MSRTGEAGYGQSTAAPYLRLETLDYRERTTETFQLNGRHKLVDLPSLDEVPELDWTLAKSSATSNQPDKRLFGSKWSPGFVFGPIVIPPVHSTYKADANRHTSNNSSPADANRRTAGNTPSGPPRSGPRPQCACGSGTRTWSSG